MDINDIVHLRIPIADLGDCTDLDFEDVVDVTEAFEPGDQLFPNPASTQVGWSSTVPSHFVRVVDLNGREHMAWNTTAMLERVGLQALSSGMYLVEVSKVRTAPWSDLPFNNPRQSRRFRPVHTTFESGAHGGAAFCHERENCIHR